MKSLAARVRIVIGVTIFVFLSTQVARSAPDTLETQSIPDTCDAATVVESDFPNFRICTDTLHDQTTTVVATSPGNPDLVLIGANITNYKPPSDGNQGRIVGHVGAFYSSNGASSFQYDTVPNSYQSGYLGGSDPSVAFDAEGRAYCAFQKLRGTQALRISTRPYDTSLWRTSVQVYPGTYNLPSIAIDQLTAQYSDSIYVAWGAPSGKIGFNRSTDLGQNFGLLASELSACYCQSSDNTHSGVSLGVLPSGVVCGAWKITQEWSQGVGVGIGFNTTDSGGHTVPQAYELIASIAGIEEGLPNKNDSVESNPVMAIDTTGGGDGIIYLAWPDVRSSDADILLIRSRDGGDTWDFYDDPIRVNNDEYGNGLDQWLPAITVAPDRSINLVFYDCRDDSLNTLTEAWAARAPFPGTGAPVFTNFKLSRVAFYPCPIPGSTHGYMTERLGIAAAGKSVYPVWSDNRYDQASTPNWGGYQAFVAPYKVYDTVGGTLASDMAIVGNVSITSTLVVPESTSLTIYGGSSITVADSAAITVLGHLRIAGGGLRPEFTGTGANGTWQGIWVTTGGSVDWGHGCVINGAGIAISEDASSTEIHNVTLSGFTGTGFGLGESVTLVNDTLTGDNADYGITIYECDPDVASCAISGCGAGIYAIGYSGSVRSTSIAGPAEYGIYLLAGENPNSDTLSVVNDDIEGHFTGAHIYAGENCKIDSCQLTTSTTDSLQSHYGVKADGAWVKLRRSSIINCDTAFYAYNCAPDLGEGTGSNAGQNIIERDSCTGACPGSYVVHECELIEERGGDPDPEPSCVDLKAEGNWWGSDSPDSSWFTKVDYTPYLGEPPSGKIVAPRSDLAVSVVPTTPVLSQNYPNPFNAGTVVEFSLASAEQVEINVYNILGQVVRALANDRFEAGRHQVIWDGRNEQGEPVASGIYLYRLVSGNAVESKKMMLLK